MVLDLPIKLFAQHNRILAVTRQVLLCGIAGVPDARLRHEVEPDVVKHGSFVELRIGTEENRSAKDSLKSTKQPPVLGAALLHAKSVEHLGCTAESDRLLLLPDCKSGQEDGDQAILPPRQTVVGMTGHLQEKLSVTAFMQQHTRRRSLNGQTAEDERAGGEAEVLAGGASLQPHALNGFQLSEFLLGKRSELRALKYSVGFLKSGDSRRAVRT